MASFPFSHEINNGVSPSLFSLFTSALCSTKYFTIAIFSLLHALIKGVSPISPFSFISAPCLSKNFTLLLFISFPLLHSINKYFPQPR
ncbi:hypothetical protein H8356DRAFT_1619425 [Neocallimastix lanati (nom. inval.)]|nr:hypothetical protein H8356DRAFT_1619425 [Neocallimastix sp. JGI-2020a]